MANCRQCSHSLRVLLSSLNCLNGIDFNSSKIARFSYIPFKWLSIMSFFIIGTPLGLFYHTILHYIYPVYAGHQYIFSQCGLRILYARFHLQNIKGGCRI